MRNPSIALLIVCTSFVCATSVLADDQPTLHIGDPAPVLEIEHWIQDAEGVRKPTIEFKEGIVYVIEFWATNCPPCLAFMPELADIQNDYGTASVRVISISDEPLAKVQEFLQNNKAADFSSKVSLTTDPDGSTKQQYMLAAGLFSIPATFIVGKTGLVEWFGSTLELKEPLRKIVDGDWDREAFAKRAATAQEIAFLIQRVGQLRRGTRGDQLQALKLIEQMLADASAPDTPEYSGGRFIQLALLISTNQLETMYAMVESRLENAQHDPSMLLESASAIAMIPPSEQGSDRAQLVNLARRQIVDVAESPAVREQPELKFALYNRLAMLYSSSGKFDDAIAALEQARQATQDKTSREFVEQMLLQAKQQAQQQASAPGK
ncbi:redoxin domain-containing protein [Aureliella helgolandensis]|uniref:Thiol-disulfide oxidoreductase n=1 Tax=Aureliella helgolandensis TaxID=2527968 RepID=A0A518GAT0_9BACT|nr:redoxin domain-containing protein [Aureliella helgolandensis]QDV25711.1 thiol-disulfide oxidoreductase [Aureliella helgolandensis]